MTRRTTFPCPVCHGRGGWHESVTDDGRGPDYDCEWCGGEGEMVIGGAKHREYTISSKLRELLWRWHDGVEIDPAWGETIDDAQRFITDSVESFWAMLDHFAGVTK